MKRAHKKSILHISLLVLIQFVSLATAILNISVLYILRASDNHKHLGHADYILLILGAMSFLISTVFLVFHLHIYFRLADIFKPPRSLLLAETTLALMSVILWALVITLVLTHLKGLSLSCQFIMSIKTTDICELSDTIIILAFVNLGGWILDFFATFLLLIRPPIASTTIFTIEAPPQRFSHPLITPLDNVFQQNRVSPEPNPDFPQLIVTSPSTKSENEEDQIKNVSLEEEGNKRVSSLYSDQDLLHPDSYLTAGIIKPIVLELPSIQVGISQMDVSFID